MCKEKDILYYHVAMHCSRSLTLKAPILIAADDIDKYFCSPGHSPGRAIVLPLASALAKSLTLKVFYVMGKALSGELSCSCDRSCFNCFSEKIKLDVLGRGFT